MGCSNTWTIGSRYYCSSYECRRHNHRNHPEYLGSHPPSAAVSPKTPASDWPRSANRPPTASLDSSGGGSWINHNRGIGCPHAYPSRRGSARMIKLQHASRWYGQVIGINDVSSKIGTGITALLGPN